MNPTADGEEPLAFACEGETLMGILHHAEGPLGVLLIVGGPQYRAGSHRFFARTARDFAAAGHPTLRFDVRGMGDSTGEQLPFVHLDADIAAAIDALVLSQPAVRRVVLWGLCDAASAALLYLQRQRDPRVAALCLLNPWARSEAGLAKAQVQHYYGRRLLQASFWLKLARGGVGLGAFGEWWRKWRSSPSGSGPVAAPADFRLRMAQGWRGFAGPVMLLTSGQDLTAKEFLDHAANDAAWDGLLTAPQVTRHDVPQADHTLSDRQHGQQACQAMLDWLAATRKQTA